MLLYLICIVILALIGLRYSGKDHFSADYLGKNNIQPIKGIFILLIFASHFTQYVQYASPLSLPYLYFRKILGQMVVVPFLFYSGYGVAYSVSTKGYTYIHRMPVKRILGVLFQFDVAVLLFFISRTLIGDHITLKDLLVSFTAWVSVGNSNWYILAILLLYTITFLVCFALSEEKRFDRQKEAAWLILFFSLCLIWILKRHKEGWYYNTITAYSAGYLYFVYKDKIERFLLRSEKSYWLIFGLLLVFFYIFRKGWNNSLTAYLAAGVVFALIIVLFTAKFTITNRVLHYCGEHLFSLFILQRLPMHILAKTPVAANIPVYFLLSLAATFILAWIFDHTVPPLWNRISAALFPAHTATEA